MFLYHTLAFTIHRKIQKSHSKIINLNWSDLSDKSGRTWNAEFELPDGSCSVSDIQDILIILQ